MSKTQLTWIGAKTFSTDTLCPELNLTCGCNKFTLLGIEFNVNLHSIPPTPDNKYFSEFNDIMYKFIWEGKPDKIKRSVSSQEYCMGGLKIPNLYIINDAIKTTWIRRYLTGDGNWKKNY